MNPLLALARPEIVALEPYAHAAWEPTLERLHANENPWRAPGDNSVLGLNRYPEPQPQSLVRLLAALYDVAAERLLIGRGSDEAIDLLVRAFCRAGVDRILVTPPTFGLYAVAARIQGAGVDELILSPGDGFAPTASAVCGRWRENTKLVFLCSPNNPTGNAYDPQNILQIARALDGKALVVIDEAYLEFAGRESLALEQPTHTNLVVLRTLSKAYALAGARCGAVIADPAVIGLLKRIVPPYAIASATIEAVEHALQAPQLTIARARVAALIRERNRLAQSLGSVRGIVRIFPSAANFLLAQFEDAQRAFERLRAAGLLVRDVRRQAGLAACLRITVGQPEQNDRVLEALEAA